MIYVHVPFCNSFCTYCDFYSEICSAKDSQQVQSRYIASLLDEINARKEELARSRKGEPDTLYFGGGTPSVLYPGAIRTIIDAINEASGNTMPFAECTIEVNPDDVVKRGGAYVKELLEAGVNRVSMGVQSLDNGILKWMNRRHDSDEARQAVRILREAGVANISIDLIFGLSQLSDAEWDNTVRQALDLQPDHISAYALSIEPGSALNRMVENGSYIPADEECCERQYNRLCQLLKEAGFHHYEISNFAKPDREAVHNSAYWTRVPYAGLGPGAHSFIKTGDVEKRLWNSQELHSWTSDEELLSIEDAATEKVMLALRTDKGMDRTELEQICGRDRIEKMLGEGLLELHSPSHSQFIRIPESRWFISDGIISDLLS